MKRLNKKISQFSEPVFEIPSNIITFNLINYNVNDFNNSLNEYISSYEGFLIKIKKYDASNDLAQKLTNDYANNLIHIFTNSLSREFHPFSMSIIKSNSTIIDAAIKLNEVSLCDVIFSKFELYVEFLSEKNHTEAMELLNIFENKGLQLLNVGNIDEAHIDNMFRSYSRASERIIDKFDLGRQPIMMSIDNQSIFYEIININYAYFDSFQSLLPKNYPLILLDTNYCVFRAFLEKSALDCSEEYSTFFKEQIYTFFSNPAKLCECNLEVKNYRGACLCLMRLCKLYELLIEFKKEDEIQTQIEYLVILAFKFAAIRHPFFIDFMSESPKQYAYDNLSKYRKYIDNIDSYIFEYSIKNNVRETESYLFELGDLFESNFNLNFNWQTKKWNSPNL